jgi:hypothetical protein
MSANIPHIDIEGLKEVVSVSDFSRRYRLPKGEENRLMKLFGLSASKHELLMNARREASFR